MMPGFQRSHFPLLTLNTNAFSFLLANSTHHVTAQLRFPKPFQSISRSTICTAPSHSALRPPPQPHMPYSLTNQELFSLRPVSLFVRKHLCTSLPHLDCIAAPTPAGMAPPFSAFSFRMLPSLRLLLLGPRCLGSSHY
ncbi:uncharacterized protein K441DRAFT_352319 [Cenococcum geophilum 1.58]|uniref:Uncharacterized protein n=1 Tax=Cenococcum geophilum 1.58 TaxID=794803 RepID=A0ACC8EN06_9PEZI|nr:hypothetical protein K441DRAFT_352319 [Cenococcum geophilum 1.58]